MGFQFLCHGNQNNISTSRISSIQPVGNSQEAAGISSRSLMDTLIPRYRCTGDIKLNVTAGVPQGSVFRPLLWNLIYDEVLRLKMEENANIEQNKTRLSCRNLNCEEVVGTKRFGTGHKKTRSCYAMSEMR